MAEAKLLAKHGGIRFFGADEGEDGAFFRIRRDQTNKRCRGWSACCDQMPLDEPSLDPVPIDGEYQPGDLIKSALYDMIYLAADKQLPGV